jgi:SAM-dependent methyltransferase
MTYERLSLYDDSLISSYSEHIQRYRFSLSYCKNKTVLDAGCGVGYGSSYLASNGAKAVVGVDISDVALSEAESKFKKPNLTFKKGDVQALDRLAPIETFDIVINFENIEHLKNADQFVRSASAVSSMLITSSPNGAVSSVTSAGQLANQFHVKEFTESELRALLSPHFDDVRLFGQWLTYAGRLRQTRARELFEQLNELYFSPWNRLWRRCKRSVGKRAVSAPSYTASADSYEGDYEILPLDDSTYPWEPATLIAVCTKLT